MFATLFRLISWFVLAGGVIVAVVDATRSVTANSLQWTTLGETLGVNMPSVALWLEAMRASLAGFNISGWSFSNVIDYLNAIPLALLAAGLFLLIYGVASRKRAPRHF